MTDLREGPGGRTRGGGQGPPSLTPPGRRPVVLSGGLAGWQLRRLQALTQGDLRGLDVSVLAETVRLSPFHFARAFKRSTGTTPGRWLMQARIERARTMLSAGDQPVFVVAHSVGYSGTAPFTRAFIAHVGVSPQAYRRR